MIAASLSGGLGNQLFQYAAGRALALRHQTRLVLNRRPLQMTPPEVPRRTYELGAFEIDAAVRRRVRSHERPPADMPAVQRGRWRMQKVFARFHVLRQDFVAYCPQFFTTGDWTHLIGYWQSEDYFVDYADVVRRDFRFRAAVEGENFQLLDAVTKTTSVSLHVRRGDYVAIPRLTKRHGVLPVDYYQEALAEIARRCRHIHVFVFSDDPAWCKEHIAGPWPLTFVDQNPQRPSEDLRLMSACRHHVIANSSFSWWGAWLDARADKLVMAPRDWFCDPELDSRRIIPEGWMRL